MNAISRLSMKDRLVSAVRGKILSGELAARARVTEQELSEEYGVSRSVVREAMLVLEHHGLIVTTPYKGSEVASITREEVCDLLIPLRIQIEQFALRSGLNRWDSAHFGRLERALNDMERGVRDKDVIAFNEADMRFHALIVEGAESDAASGVWNVIDQRTRMHLAFQTGRGGPLQPFLADHRSLLDTFRSGNLDASLAAIEFHIRDTNLPLLGLLEAGPDQPAPSTMTKKKPSSL
jgi:DNA-binding GntR family transcriptional regulator